MEKNKSILGKIFFGAAIGIVIGIILELVFSAVHGDIYLPGSPAYLAKFQNQNIAVGLERVAYAFLGIILSVASKLYEEENLSLLKASSLHLLVAFTSVTITAYLLNWIPAKPSAYFGFSLFFLVVYTLIWIIIGFCIRQHIKKINQKIGSGTEK